MKKFKYTAMNLQKEIFKGTFVAEDEKDLALQLAKQSLFLLSAKPYSDVTPSAFFSTSGKVTTSELTLFARQFSIMINSGMSIVDCIEILKSQGYTAMLRGVLERVYEDIKGGTMLSDALEKHKKVFPNFFRSMIKVGELSGKLEQVLMSLSDYYESDNKIKKEIVGALAYPITLFAMMIGIVVLMLAFIIPTFRDALSSLDITVSGLTAAVYNLSDFLLENGLNLLAGIVGIVLLFVLFGFTKKGKFVYSKWKVKLPMIGTITTNIISARFARGFGLLLSGGMDISDAMESICKLLGNEYIESLFKKAIEDVRQGMSLSMAFQTHKLFPQMLIQMVSVGERTASLDDVLNRSSNFFDEQVKTSLSSIAGTLQPIMLGLIGGVVGILFLAVYSPMLEIMGTIA